MKRKICGLLCLLLLTGCAAEPVAEEAPAAPPVVVSEPEVKPEPVPEPEPEPMPEPEPEPEPEPFSWFEPVADEVPFPEGDVSVFDAYAAAHPEWEADPGQLYREEDGRVVWKNRAWDGGVLPGEVESIVYDPETGEITERISLWRRQGGWPGETVTLTEPTYGMKLTVPAGEEAYISYDGLEGYVMTPGHGEEGLFHYSIPSTAPGRVLSLYRLPIQLEDEWFSRAFEIYPEWSLLHACGEEIARDDRYLYFWGYPSDVQYADAPGEQELYCKRMMLSGFLADAFVRDNGLRECPYSLQMDSGWNFSMCLMANSLLVEGGRLYCRLWSYGDPLDRSDPYAWNCWRWEFTGETADGPASLEPPPARKWGESQRYELDLSAFTSLTATLTFNLGETVISIPILD